MRSNRWRAAAWGLLLAATACGGPREEMPTLPLPDDYVENLEGFRATRDDYFRRDPASPLPPESRAEFAGLDYFAVNPDLYFVGDLHLYERPETLTMVTTAGAERPAERIGWVAFRVAGRTQRLQVYRLLDGDGGPFLPFQDATTGERTYPAGRYVELVPHSPAGPWELDFNRAHNPSCAYGSPERYACPVTPPENRLAVAIEAGERGAGTGES